MSQNYIKRIPSFLLLRLSMSRWLSSKIIRPYLVRLAGIKMGKNAHVGANVTFDTIDPAYFEIGDNVVITMNCVLLMHYLKPLENGQRSWHIGKLKIGNNVFVGANSVIAKPVTIGNNVVIAAGSVVTHSIPCDSIAAGNPCKVIKKLVNK